MRSLGLLGLGGPAALNSSDFQLGKEKGGWGVGNPKIRHRGPASPSVPLGFILRKSNCYAICFLVKDLVISYHFFFFFF